MASPKASGSGAASLRSLSIPAPRAGSTASCESILLTGFGPFPGVTRNVSADLVQALAQLAGDRHRHLAVIADVLPVDWHEAPDRLSTLLRQHQPGLVLHFGVSQRASGFVIERHAYNVAKPLPDGAGRLAASTQLVAGDRARRTATLPVRRLVETLQRAGYPAELSSDPGRYLCNAVLYHSLRLAARAAPRTRAGFVHIPAALDPISDAEPALIGWGDAVSGGLEIIDSCLALLRQRNRDLS